MLCNRNLKRLIFLFEIENGAANLDYLATQKKC